MLRVMRVLALAVVVATGFAAQAVAVPIVYIDPPTQTVPVGATVDIAIKVKDLTEPIGAFEILLSFDDAILSGDDYETDPDDKLGPGGFDFSFGFLGGGLLDLFHDADPAFDAADLAAAQGTGFTLATVRFTALAPTTPDFTLLRLEVVDLSDADGLSLLDRKTEDGRVCVGDAPCGVPEPAMFTLLATGVAVFAARRRRSRRA
jgi:hypothetical protein